MPIPPPRDTNRVSLSSIDANPLDFDPATRLKTIVDAITIGKKKTCSQKQETQGPLKTDNGFLVGTESYSNINEIAVTPKSQGGVSSRVYENTATANNGAISIDLHLTLIDTFDQNGKRTTGTAEQLPVAFSDFSAGPILLARKNGSSKSGYKGHTAHIKVEFFDSGCGSALDVIGDFTFRDIDFIPSNDISAGAGSEAVTAVRNEIQSYEISSDPVTSITTENNSDGTIRFINYRNSGGPNDEQRWARIKFHGTQSLNLTFQARNANTGYGLSTAKFSRPPITHSPRKTQGTETLPESNLSGSDLSRSGNAGVSHRGNYGDLVIKSNGTYVYALRSNNPEVAALSPKQTLSETFDYTVSNSAGKLSPASLTITIADANTPRVVGRTIPPQSNIDGESINALEVSTYLSYSQDQSATYFAVNLPTGLSIDPATGDITGQLENDASQDAAGGIFNVELIATAPNGGSVSTTFDWTIANPVLLDHDATGSDSNAGNAAAVSRAASTATGAIAANSANGLANNPPAINIAIPDQAHCDRDIISVNISKNFRSFDGKPLTFDATGLPLGLSINSAGDITGTIDRIASQNGAYTVVITATDAAGGKVTDTFSWTISNPALTSQGDASLIVRANIPDQTNSEGVNINVDISPNFSGNERGGLTFSATGLPAGMSIASAGNITGKIDTRASQNGPYTVVIRAQASNGDSVTDTFTWNILNSSPLAGASADNLESDTDSELNAVHVDQIKGQPNDAGIAIKGDYGTIQINSDGSYTYALDSNNPAIENLDVGQSLAETFQYMIEDGDGESGTAELTIAIEAPNASKVNEACTSPSNGRLSLNPNGSFTYQPTSNIYSNDTFDCKLRQPSGARATATVKITVDGANRDPSLKSLPDQSNQRSDTVRVDLRPIAAGLDAGNLTFSVTGLPPGLSVSDGFVTGKIYPNAPSGRYLVCVSATDQRGGIAMDDFVWNFGIPSDRKPELTFSLLNQPRNGSVELQSNGTFTYTPSPGFDGIDIFEYTIADAGGAARHATVAIDVAPIDDATAELRSTSQNAVSLSLVANDAHPENLPSTASLITNAPSNGIVFVNPDGSVTYAPEAGFLEADSFEYEVCEQGGSSNIAAVRVKVARVNQIGNSKGASTTVVKPESKRDSSSNFSQPHFANSTCNLSDSAGSKIGQKIFTLTSKPIFNGYAGPNTQISGRIYNASGSLVGEASTSSDLEGNWSIHFQNVKGHEFHRVEFETVSETAAGGNNRFGLHRGDSSYQSMSPMTSFGKRLSV